MFAPIVLLRFAGKSTQWEYKTLSTRESPRPIDDLNRLGAEGWEAYAYSDGLWQLKRRK